MNCIKCGKELAEGSKFCKSCGHEVGQATAGTTASGETKKQRGFNRNLSWKFLIPFGIVVWILFYGGAFGIIGTICIIFGIVDFFRSRRKAAK